MPGRVTLKVVGGPLVGRTYDFAEHDTFIFGRAADCHAALSPNDKTASRHHFILEVNPPFARLRDLGSLNGTFVNKKKCGGRPDHETPEEAARRAIPEVDLKHGDRIEVGATAFSVEIEAPHTCSQCGCSIAISDPDAALWAPDKWVCGRCRPTLLVAATAPSDDTTRAPDFERGRLLGKGGMGAVYLGRRQSDGREVAIKTLLPKVAVDVKARTMFLREIDVARSLSHPNIVELFEHGEDAQGFYFVMEYCAGGNLDDLRARSGGRLGWADATRFVIQALDGLVHAHERGFVHRDIKPQNILLTGNESVAKLSDFGLAKSFERAGLSGFTGFGAVGGTYVFMAREQLTNFKFARPVSDVWSMGAVLYVLITGRPPRPMRAGDDPVEVILRGAITPIRTHEPSVPASAATAIDRALADKANDRFQSASEFRGALMEAVAGAGV